MKKFKHFCMRLIKCFRCGGTGTFTSGETCYYCHGEGYVEVDDE